MGVSSLTTRVVSLLGNQHPIIFTRMRFTQGLNKDVTVGKSTVTLKGHALR